MQAREKHPHLHLFVAANNWKYLIIGTFPPNTALREKIYIDYFYGNKGFLWKIIHDIYNDRGYDFFAGTALENVKEIQRWQNDYCVGLTDTIAACRRKEARASEDAALLDIEYNFALRKQVLDNLDRIEKLIFTSTSGKNSAFRNFRIIMGDDLKLVGDKLVTGLPSPSGAGNITFFNTGKEETLGLTEDFYHYVRTQRPELLYALQNRWELKKKKNTGASVIIPASPAGLVTEYKLWRYRNVLPQSKCR